jgi:hypothetical protein
VDGRAEKVEFAMVACREEEATMPPSDENYWKTEAGQFIFQSWRYLRAARVLRNSTDWRVELQSPTLHTLAHGIELLCKFPLIGLGRSQLAIKKEYGHDLSLLWLAPENVRLRAAVYPDGRLTIGLGCGFARSCNPISRAWANPLSARALF